MSHGFFFRVVSFTCCCTPVHWFCRSVRQEILSGYFVVEPTVRIRGQPIPIPALVIETVLTKCLGISENWMERLKVSVETGFNAIHFTPVHALGESRSAYSLRSNSDLEPSQFPQCKDAGSRWAALTEIIRQLEHEHGVLSLQDCVWNHVSPYTDWLREHPEVISDFFFSSCISKWGFLYNIKKFVLFPWLGDVQHA